MSETTQESQYVGKSRTYKTVYILSTVVTEVVPNTCQESHYWASSFVRRRRFLVVVYRHRWLCVPQFLPFQAFSSYGDIIIVHPSIYQDFNVLPNPSTSVDCLISYGENKGLRKLVTEQSTADTMGQARRTMSIRPKPTRQSVQKGPIVLQH